MQEILDWGIDVVLGFQHYSPTFDLTFIAFSFTGSELFFLFLLPLISWCISPRVGVRLLILVLLNTYVNAVAKLLFAQPRPFDYDPRVLKIEHAVGGGLPSGHTQTAVIFWGYLSHFYKKKWLWGIALIMVIFVPLSRIYLGVHFPTDLLGGYIIGLIMLMLFIKFEQPFIDWIRSKTLKGQLLLASSFPLILLVIAPDIDQIIISISAVLTGALVGTVIANKYLEYHVPELIWKRIACYFVGIIILFAIYVGLKKVFIGLEPAPIYRYVRYTLVGFHFTFFAPWLFTKLRIA